MGWFPNFFYHRNVNWGSGIRPQAGKQRNSFVILREHIRTSVKAKASPVECVMSVRPAPDEGEESPLAPYEGAMTHLHPHLTI